MWGLTEYSGQTVLFPKERDEAGNGLEDEGPCRPPSPPFFFCSSSESLFCSCSFPLQLFQIPLMSHHQSLAKPASQMFAFTTLSAWFLLFHYSYHWPETWKHGKGKKGLFFFLIKNIFSTSLGTACVGQKGSGHFHGSLWLHHQGATEPNVPQIIVHCKPLSSHCSWTLALTLLLASGQERSKYLLPSLSLDSFADFKWL